MAWINNKYFYSVKLLRYIAENWDNLYEDGIEFNDESATCNSFSIAEFRADFCYGYKSLSKRMRYVVRADIEGISDRVLEQRGYYELGKFRRTAYHLIKEYLNGERG